MHTCGREEREEEMILALVFESSLAPASSSPAVPMTFLCLLSSKSIYLSCNQDVLDQNKLAPEMFIK